MRARLGLTILLTVAVAPALQAQSRLVVAPSISVGFVYDDNLFYEPTGSLEAIWRVTPGLTVTRETARNALFADLSFDVERFREHTALSTPLARQSALLRVRQQATPRVSVGFEGGFEGTRAPTELNLTTGLLTGRRRAIRFYGGPTLSADITPVTTATFDYELSADIVPEGALLLSGTPGEIIEAQAPASRLWSHTASSRLTYNVTPRHAFRLDYVGRFFVFADRAPTPTSPIATPGAPPAPTTPSALSVPRDPIVRHTGLLGWTYRINPAVKVDLAAGPRFRFGEFDFDGMEWELLVSRVHPTHDVYLSYVRTVATAVGLTSLIEVDRAMLRAVYRPPFGIAADGEVGFYRSNVDDQDVTVFRVGTGVTLPLGGPVSLGVSYAVDYQRGRFGLNPAAPPPVVPGPDVDPLRFLDPDAPMRHGVALIRLIIAPSMRRTPEDPPPGATPVRTPPVKRSDR